MQRPSNPVESEVVEPDTRKPDGEPTTGKSEPDVVDATVVETSVEAPVDTEPLWIDVLWEDDEPLMLEIIEDRLPNWVVRKWLFFCSVCHWLFGMLSLVLGLAFLATIPIVNLLSLGYLLEASGRVSRSGRLRDGFVGVRKASRIGSIVLGTWVLLLPLRLISELRDSARLIDPSSGQTAGLGNLLVVATCILVGQILWAWYRGGKLRHFLWPAPIRFWRALREPNKFVRTRDAVWQFVLDLHLGHYFWLGLRGFVGAIVWLVFPVAIWGLAYAISASAPQPVVALLSFLGGLVFAMVMLYLPFLQAHFAAENRLRAMFEVGQVRAVYRRAPLAFLVALFITLLLALPLYLLKIEMTPREVAWLPSLLFVVFIFPARLLTGWALGRGRHRETPRHFATRWLCRFAALPVVGFFAIVVYVTQYLSWYGPSSLLEQHALLVPVPFLNM